MNDYHDILNLKSLSIGYNAGTKSEKVLLPSINLSVIKGEMVSLLGPNGIGKSTLLKTISGLHPVIKGEILLSKKNLNQFSGAELARKISFVFTGGISVYNMSVFELVALGRFPHTNWMGRLTESDRAIINRSIDSVGLMKFSGKNIGEMSDGEKQRAMIARALAQDTELIILDEPTAFLDLPNRYELVELLRKLSAENNKSVVFSSHDIHIAIREADKVWLATEKGIVQGSPEDLALSGKFDHLFIDSDLTFIPGEGVFTYPVRTRMTIKLEGEGLMLYWTERALNRLGIRAKKEAVSPSVKITSEKEGEYTWVYESSVEKMKFKDIYSLILYMKRVLKG
ncbi:MAG TPA: ABC transporter ATP-binding protein [Bacteroidales bacterium]|nr:ABC transporter ATP-binding protein [Bacteroidales bacterium]